MGGDVPGGVDVRVGGAQRRVHGDPAVGQVEAGSIGQRDVRDDADADDDGVGRDRGAVAQLDAGDPALTQEAADPGAEPQVDPMIAMQPGERRAHLLARAPGPGAG